MKKKPLVSIIITYYKKKKFIKKTLQSILNQTYKNFELIFVYDDNDYTEVEYIKILLKKFKNKTIIVNKKNLGVAKSRNLGIKFSKGKYLAFIDSDDLWKKNKLLMQLGFMEKNNHYFTFTSYSVIDENNRVIKHRKVKFDANYSNLYRKNFIGLSTVIIKKHMILDINFPNLSTQEDFGLWLKLARRGHELKHMKNVLSSWRYTKNSLSSNVFNKLKNAFKLYHLYEKKNLISSFFSVLVLSFNKLVKK